MPRTGKEAMIEQFLADGITHMFGNPGTVEQGFLDALESFPDFHYILTLQETVAAGVADGFARATGCGSTWSTSWINSRRGSRRTASATASLCWCR